MAIVLKRYIEPYLRARPATVLEKMQNKWFRCHDQVSFEQNARQIYLEHYAKVRRLIPKERLLEYKLGSGWEPLCDFLNKPVPDKDFPRVNESKEFEIWMANTQKKKLKEGVLSLSKYFVLPVLASGIVWFLSTT